MQATAALHHQIEPRFEVYPAVRARAGELNIRTWYTYRKNAHKSETTLRRAEYAFRFSHE